MQRHYICLASFSLINETQFSRTKWMKIVVKFAQFCREYWQQIERSKEKLQFLKPPILQ
jgi:hypothetical protein